jgi:hypothetical protein
VTHGEFGKRLDQLREVITLGLAYYAVWKKLSLHDASKVSWSLEDQNRLLGRFWGFFTPVSFALLDMALMQFAKAFDRDPGTASLTNLLRAARQDTSLIPRASAGDMDKVSAQLRQSKRLLTGLKRRRNQHLAHVDANPEPVDPMLNTEFDKLVDDVKSAFDFLSKAHDGRVYGWEQSLRPIDDHTTEILRILQEEMGRKQKEYQEEIVRIGLKAVREQQGVFGRRLDRAEVRSIVQSYGLTEEQMQRVEQEYDLS